MDAINNHRYTYLGYYNDSKGLAQPVMAYSDNLIEWNNVQYMTDELGNLKGASVALVDGVYYVCGVNALYKTTDFINFTQLDFKLGDFDDIQAPTIFNDVDGASHIIYSAKNTDETFYRLYLADFSHDAISEPQQLITFNKGQLGNTDSTDPYIYVQDGTYYLVTGGNYIYTATNYTGPYDRLKVNFAPTPEMYGVLKSGISHWVNRPYMFKDGNNVRLFADDADGTGLVYQSANSGDLTKWGTRQLTVSPDYTMHAGTILVNEDVAPGLVHEEIDDSAEFNPVMTIQAHGSNNRIPLTCYQCNTLNYQYENNQTNSLQFTAYDDGSPSFPAVGIDSLITFNNDLFIIKQVQPTLTGINLPQITAIQYVNSEISRIFQHNVQTGTLTYTVQDVLNYWLGDSSVNFLGFTYAIHGTFSKQQIQDLGNDSGSDMTSKILDTWEGTIIRGVNKVIHVYSADAFVKQSQKRIDYIHDTSEIDLAIDSTAVYNQVKCIGATVDTSNSDSDTDNDTETYYFNPFFVSDQESINNWGLHPMPDLSDDRFTNADSMKAYGLTQLTPDPVITTTLTFNSNVQPIPGEKARLNIQTMNYSTDVTVVSFTWYPFSESQKTQVTYDNLPASILHQDNSRNNLKILNELKAQLGSVPQVFYSNSDPSNTNNIKNGAIWVKPIEATADDSDSINPDGTITGGVQNGG